jgi:hypothetical protein
MHKQCSQNLWILNGYNRTRDVSKYKQATIMALWIYRDVTKFTRYAFQYARWPQLQQRPASITGQNLDAVRNSTPNPRFIILPYCLVCHSFPTISANTYSDVAKESNHLLGTCFVDCLSGLITGPGVSLRNHKTVNIFGTGTTLPDSSYAN